MEHLAGIDLGHPDLTSTAELLDSGLHGRDITRLVRNGALVRLRHGAYTTGDAWAGLSSRGRRHLIDLAALRGARTGAVLSHTSAASRLGAPVWDLPALSHLSRLDQRAGRREAGKIQHRGALIAEDVTIRDGVPLTSGTRTAFDVMASTDVEHALVVVNGLLAAGETSTDLLSRRSPGLERIPGSLTTRLVLGFADARCTSAGESRTHLLLHRHGLTPVVLQYPVVGRHGSVVAYLDFAWPERRAFLEFDGRVKYASLRRPGESVTDVVMREKAREQLVVSLTGWRAIRIAWADLDRPARTAARIHAFLDSRPCVA